MYFLYLLECKDKSLYCGITTDLTRRFEEHKTGIGSKYTKAHGAKKIIYSKKFKNRSEASKAEYKIKKLTRMEKLELIKLNNRVPGHKTSRPTKLKTVTS